jgi:c-di-GMP-binding flagellar brake protein YcgR
VSDRDRALPQERRRAVRAPVRLPVTLVVGSQRLRGSTIDISEGGAACAVTPDPRTTLPVVGSRLEVELVLDSGRAWLPGDVLGAVHRRGWWIVTVRFAEPAERDQDRVRRHVFTVLRRDRAAGFG